MIAIVSMVGADAGLGLHTPKLNVPEDPVTGSAHCQLAPYWAQRLNKNHILARQASRRGGTLQCVVVGDRVQILGTAVDYLKGTIKL